MEGLKKHIFGSHFENILSAQSTRNISDLDSELVELVLAGIYIFQSKNIIWIVEENEDLEQKKFKLEKWLEFLNPGNVEVSIYSRPFEDPYINNYTDINAQKNKMNLILSLMGGKNQIIISTLSALNIKIERGKLFSGMYKEMQLNRDISRNTLIEILKEYQYNIKDYVKCPGDFAYRGSIVDFFPVGENFPVRVEIEADRVTSIRTIDIRSQISIEPINKVKIFINRFFLNYGQNIEYMQDNHKEMEYLTKILKQHVIVFSDQFKIKTEYKKLLNNYAQLYKVSHSSAKGYKGAASVFKLALKENYIFNMLEDLRAEAGDDPSLKYYNKTVLTLNETDLKDLNHRVNREGYKLFVFCRNKKTLDHLKNRIGEIFESKFILPVSFVSLAAKYLFLAEKEMVYHPPVLDEEELDPGNILARIKEDDTVVHNKHGIGRFIGFNKLKLENIETEFLKIAYKNNEYLYVPIYEVDILTKYSAIGGSHAQLDKLGGKSWDMKKKRARKSIINYARELLQLYALRKSIKGYGYVKDSELENKFIQGFSFVETQDQKNAIKTVLRDLEKEYPMDRLICGDVSFGKTEVALRAATRVVSNGKQVALLCPTTILAYQHYQNFKKRFSDLPVKVAMLSRMVKKKERERILENLSRGRIDVIIGTHSILSRDLIFYNLGLYILDEEQRFGVFQKEKLKKNREDIDVLTLSATPIPRTLSLAMAGLSDISSISSPPLGRIAVKNYIGYFSRKIIISALLKEIGRNGQAFIIYNSIEKIFSLQNKIKEWLPDLKTVVIHADMKSTVIEDNLLKFINRDYQVLISTTIIENGIDIPNVNTLIILEAEGFGLTQLYQLRGRIGRSNRQAYAFFLISTASITEKAKMRLRGIKEFTELGSGYEIAKFDYKIRGAGSLLGNRQHGHMEALGFDYYNKLLNRTVQELKGKIREQKEPVIKVGFSTTLDSVVFSGTGERISIYKKILDAKKHEDIIQLRKDLIDRYGRLTENSEKIFYIGFIRLIARYFNLEKVEIFEDKIYCKLQESTLKTFKNIADHFSLKEVDEHNVIIYTRNYKYFLEHIDRIVR